MSCTEILGLSCTDQSSEIGCTLYRAAASAGVLLNHLDKPYADMLYILHRGNIDGTLLSLVMESLIIIFCFIITFWYILYHCVHLRPFPYCWGSVVGDCSPPPPYIL